jgi:hypothetical protein
MVEYSQPNLYYYFGRDGVSSFQLRLEFYNLFQLVILKAFTSGYGIVIVCMNG